MAGSLPGRLLVVVILLLLLQCTVGDVQQQFKEEAGNPLFEDPRGSSSTSPLLNGPIPELGRDVGDNIVTIGKRELASATKVAKCKEKCRSERKDCNKECGGNGNGCRDRCSIKKFKCIYSCYDDTKCRTKCTSKPKQCSEQCTTRYGIEKGENQDLAACKRVCHVKEKTVVNMCFFKFCNKPKEEEDEESPPASTAAEPTPSPTEMPTAPLDPTLSTTKELVTPPSSTGYAPFDPLPTSTTAETTTRLLPVLIDIQLIASMGIYCGGITNISRKFQLQIESIWDRVIYTFDREFPARTFYEPVAKTEAVNTGSSSAGAGTGANNPLNVCSVCKSKKKWKECVKNKCSKRGSSSTRRVLWVSSESIEGGSSRSLKMTKDELQQVVMDEVKNELNSLVQENKTVSHICPLEVDIVDLSKEVQQGDAMTGPAAGAPSKLSDDGNEDGAGGGSGDGYLLLLLLLPVILVLVCMMCGGCIPYKTRAGKIGNTESSWKNNNHNII